jgi:hypothetical protein
VFSVTAADFVLDVHDYLGDDGSGATFTEVVGYFRPRYGTDTRTGTDAGTDGADAEPDLVGIAVLAMPAGTPGALAAWRAFRNPAGPAAIGQAMQAAITACPCAFPAAGCAAMDDDVLRQAIDHAAALTVNGQEGR